MLPKDVLAKIRLIEIRTKKLLSGSGIGDYKTKQKGFGLEFEQLNDYQLGHDIRFIDWKSSARAGKMLVKQYYDEKNRTILLAIDISQSSFFGSHYGSKYDINAQLASILAFVGYYSNDLVGLILFAENIEIFVPPARGRKHITILVEKIFSVKPRNKKTSLAAMLRFVGSLRVKDAILIIVSDFLDTSFDKRLSVVALRYSIFAFRCLDFYEKTSTNAGFLLSQDIETGQSVVLDMRKKNGSYFSALLQERKREQDTLFKRYGVSYLDISTDKPYLEEVIRFFQARVR